MVICCMCEVNIACLVNFPKIFYVLHQPNPSSVFFLELRYIFVIPWGWKLSHIPTWILILGKSWKYSTLWFWHDKAMPIQIQIFSLWCFQAQLTIVPNKYHNLVIVTKKSKCTGIWIFRNYAYVVISNMKRNVTHLNVASFSK